MRFDRRTFGAGRVRADIDAIEPLFEPSEL